MGKALGCIHARGEDEGGDKGDGDDAGGVAGGFSESLIEGGESGGGGDAAVGVGNDDHVVAPVEFSGNSFTDAIGVGVGVGWGAGSVGGDGWEINSYTAVAERFERMCEEVEVSSAMEGSGDKNE